jgi:hypothetical protein
MGRLYASLVGDILVATVVCLDLIFRFGVSIGDSLKEDLIIGWLNCYTHITMIFSPND